MEDKIYLYNAICTIKINDIEARTEEEAKQTAKDRVLNNGGDWDLEVEQIEEVEQPVSEENDAKFEASEKRAIEDGSIEYD